MQVSNSYKQYRINQEFKEIVAHFYPGKVSLLDFFIMQHIAFNTEEGCTQYDLSKCLHLAPARIHPVIKRLYEDGMIAITVDEETMRIKKILTITPQGQDILDKVYAVTMDLLDNSHLPGNPHHEEYLAHADYLDLMFEKLSTYKLSK